jgi:hypothetical protein
MPRRKPRTRIGAIPIIIFLLISFVAGVIGMRINDRIEREEKLHPAPIAIAK